MNTDAYLTGNTITIILVLAALVVFLSLLMVFKYAIADNFTRMRFIMTSFLVFIVTTLSISFWHYALYSLWFTLPAFGLGLALGYGFGVKAAERRLATNGVRHYIEHFHRISKTDLKALNWWSLVNFYSIMGGLVIMNMVGLSVFLFPGFETIALATTVIGAFLIGTLVPYIVHLWSVDHERV